MLTEQQLKSYEFFQKSLPSLLEDPLKNGKYAVVCGEAIAGLFDSFQAAYAFACAECADSHFIIQQIVNQNDIVQFLRMAVV